MDFFNSGQGFLFERWAYLGLNFEDPRLTVFPCIVSSLILFPPLNSFPPFRSKENKNEKRSRWPRGDMTHYITYYTKHIKHDTIHKREIINHTIRWNTLLKIITYHTIYITFYISHMIFNTTKNKLHKIHHT